MSDTRLQSAATEGFRAEGWIGRLVDGRYQVESLLGEGGMGAVFLAEHVKLSKKVALKVILPQFAGDGELAERFAREAMASAQIDHPHVASALDYGSLAEGGAYLVMPYVRGRSLRDAMNALSSRSDAAWPFACEIGAQIADALSAAHAQRIVHRDLKPENVILEPREDGSELVRVLDFGIARVVNDEAQQATTSKALTRVGTIIGTPGYMAPEQALGESVDTRADLYALGVVLWEIVAQTQLFPEAEITALLTRQLTSVPPRLTSLGHDIPEELDELIARLLARARDERPDRAGEVRDILRRLALGATLEQKMLSGEISLPKTPTTHSHTLTLHRTLDKVTEKLKGNLDIGPLHAVPVLALVLTVAIPFALVVFALGLALVIGGGESAPPTPPVASPPIAVSSPPPDIPRVEASTPAAPPPALARPQSTPIPIELARDVATLLDASNANERAAAGRRLREMNLEEAPAFVPHVMSLELASNCRERRDAVRALGELADPRALVALERIDRARRGCGFLGSQDCHRCLRRDLRTALSALRRSDESR